MTTEGKTHFADDDTLAYIADLERQLAEAKAETESMRPMISACAARYERHLGGHISGNDYPCPCLTCAWYREYLERKQP